MLWKSNEKWAGCSKMKFNRDILYVTPSALFLRTFDGLHLLSCHSTTVTDWSPQEEAVIDKLIISEPEIVCVVYQVMPHWVTTTIKLFQPMLTTSEGSTTRKHTNMPCEWFNLECHCEKKLLN